jgi:hypothetical protein
LTLESKRRKAPQSDPVSTLDEDNRNSTQNKNPRIRLLGTLSHKKSFMDRYAIPKNHQGSRRFSGKKQPAQCKLHFGHPTSAQATMFYHAQAGEFPMAHRAIPDSSVCAEMSSQKHSMAVRSRGNQFCVMCWAAFPGDFTHRKLRWLVPVLTSPLPRVPTM